jgi:hypothetical protein
MSKLLSNAAINSFDALVKQTYQGTGKLRPTVRLKSGVVGSTHKFPKMGKGIATPRIPQTDVIPMGIPHTGAIATLGDWNAPEYTDIFDQAATNIDERKALAYIIASAIGRREDQMIIDALDAVGAVAVGVNIGGTSTNMNTAKARAAKGILDASGVPVGERVMLIHTDGLNNGMLADTVATSSDYNAVKALVQGELDTWLGFKWLTIENRDEGGLPKVSTTRTCFAYHGGMMGSIGLAIKIDFRTEVNYIPEKTSWLANGIFSAGAIGIDAAGIVEINATEV